MPNALMPMTWRKNATRVATMGSIRSSVTVCIGTPCSTKNVIRGW
jgi:hypothetical protein